MDYFFFNLEIHTFTNCWKNKSQMCCSCWGIRGILLQVIAKLSSRLSWPPIQSCTCIYSYIRHLWNDNLYSLAHFKPAYLPWQVPSDPLEQRLKGWSLDWEHRSMWGLATSQAPPQTHWSRNPRCGPRRLGFRWFWCTLKLEIHWSRVHWIPQKYPRGENFHTSQKWKRWKHFVHKIDLVSCEIGASILFRPSVMNHEFTHFNKASLTLYSLIFFSL